MRTNTAPWDYKKRVAIVSRLERLCEICGDYVIAMPDGVRCASCKHTGYVEVWEHMAHTFRRGLWEKEVEKAICLAGLMPDIGGAVELAGGNNG